MMTWIRRFVLSIIAVLTAVYIYRFANEGSFEAVTAWHGRWQIIAIGFALNWTGITMEFVCWRWIYARCGVAAKGIAGGAIYFSIFASQLLPLQTGRLVRPDAAQRLGMGSMRNGVEAELALVFLDIVAIAALLVLLATWTLLPWAAPLLALVVVSLGLGLARVVAGWTSLWFQALRPELLWSLPAWCTVAVRMADRALLGAVLYLLVVQDTTTVSYINAALYLAAADTLGAASGTPGGMGVIEPALVWLLSLTQMPGAPIVVAVALHRIITYLGQLPLSWAALLYVEIIKRAPDNAGAEE